jgi:O-methyltransferase
MHRVLATTVALSLVLLKYFDPATGSEYEVGPGTKATIAAKMLRNHRRIPTGSTIHEHLVIAIEVLNLSPDEDGCIVECGCYKGGSTANLSLLVGLCDRRLEVFDSFEGMPTPEERDRNHMNLDSGRIHIYSENDWDSSLEEVRRNVAKYGDGSVCTFHPGYFEETLPTFEEDCALVFLDVGLRASAEVCLDHLWPLLGNNHYLFTHDVTHMEISALFFDDTWWETHLERSAPGMVGSGTGLGLHPGSNGFSSSLGYTVKAPQTDEFTRVMETGVTRGDSTN